MSALGAGEAEPLYTAAEMRAAEERYPGFPGTAPELMARAARAVADEVLRAYPGARTVAVVCGKGSNGGDGRIAGELLREAGLEVAETQEPGRVDVVVDALFGTGFTGVPREAATATIARIGQARAAGAAVVAVDLPSGVDATTGEAAGAAVIADVTVTFHGRKLGLAVAPGRDRAGRVVIADIGLEHAPTGAVRALPSILSRVPLRAARDSKYTAGHVAIVGGSEGMAGAAVLAATAALRADAGYVTMLVPRGSLAAVEALTLEPVKRPFDWVTAARVVTEVASRVGAVAIGPGLGRSPAAGALVRDVLAAVDVPVVVDADALHGLRPVERAAPTVLTPHAGELARLLDRDSAWVEAHRLEAARSAAGTFGAVVLLKGPDTLVVAPDGVVVCEEGPPSLATAGTGDVLTGIVAAFLAKGLEPVVAAAAGAVAHGLAARAVRHQAGLVAGDVAAALPSVLS